MSWLIIGGHGLYGVTVQIVTEYNQWTEKVKSPN